MYHTQNLVFITGTKRETCMFILLNQLHNLVKTAVLVDTNHILSRYHNFVCKNFRETNSILDNFAFCIINNPAFLRSINNKLNFFFGVSIFVFISLLNAHQFQNPDRNMIKTPNNRSANFIKRIKRNRNKHRITFGILNSHRLWYQLT